MRMPSVMIRALRPFSAALVFMVSLSLSAQVTGRVPMTVDLAGTSWQLVRFQGGDGTTLLPTIRPNYIINLGADGRVTARIDCNTGTSTWASTGGNQLTFGPLATTRVRCSSNSMFNQIVRQWPYVRTYTLRNGHLFLSLMADGGIYEFEPINGAPSSSLSSARSVTGTATYRERIALPANAVFEATLEDVSRSAAQGEIIARIRNEQPGNAPIPFTIAYDPGRILSSRTYAIRAEIVADGRLWFTTDQSYPVVTRGNPSDVQLVLRRATGQNLPPRTPSSPTVENTYWKLIYLGNTAVRRDARRPEASIVLHSQNQTVAGSGGCNRFSGSYTLSGDRVSFGRVASTMMACTDGMDTEQTFYTALGRTRRWRILGQTLELLDDRGNSVARFQATYLP